MTAGGPSPSELRFRLEDCLQRNRRDALTYSIGAILLTPLFLFLALLGVAMAMIYADLPFVDYAGYGVSITTGANVFVAWMLFINFRKNASWHHQPKDKRWLWGALLSFGVMLLLSYGTSMPNTAPVAFLVFYVVGMLAVFGCLGRLYMPRNDYYLGLWHGLFDDFTTIQDDFDRGHLSLGFATAFPNAIIMAYAEILSSSWLWRPLSERELIAASEVLYGLMINDRDRVERMVVRDRALYALNRLEYVKTLSGSIELTLKGKDFLAGRTS